jgi:hypothetical protein
VDKIFIEFPKEEISEKLLQSIRIITCGYFNLFKNNCQVEVNFYGKDRRTGDFRFVKSQFKR